MSKNGKVKTAKMRVIRLISSKYFKIGKV